MQREIRKLGLSEHIELTGLVSDVRVVLSRSTVFVLPSYLEALPVTGLERVVRAETTYWRSLRSAITERWLFGRGYRCV